MPHILSDALDSSKQSYIFVLAACRTLLRAVGDVKGKNIIEKEKQSERGAKRESTDRDKTNIYLTNGYSC